MRRARAAQTDFIKTAGLNVLFFACGTLITRGAVLGDMAPFGSSYAASVPKRRLIPSLLGTALGYILLKPSDSFRYIAVIIAIGCARWLLSDIGKISSSKPQRTSSSPSHLATSALVPAIMPVQRSQTRV